VAVERRQREEGYKFWYNAYWKTDPETRRNGQFQEAGRGGLQIRGAGGACRHPGPAAGAASGCAGEGAGEEEGGGAGEISGFVPALFPSPNGRS
jgi:hypothetical protein